MNPTHITARKQRPLYGDRIGLFGRGGSGKSTVTVFLAKALTELGYPVCVVDADSTNEGLARALGADRAPDSLLEWLGGTVFEGECLKIISALEEGRGRFGAPLRGELAAAIGQ